MLTIEVFGYDVDIHLLTSAIASVNMVFSGGYHDISNTLIVNNCILITSSSGHDDGCRPKERYGGEKRT